MSKKSFVLVCFVVCSLTVFAQKGPHNVILVTFDGFRWQELFTGADSALLFNPKCSQNQSVRDLFWDPVVSFRRRKLLPFIGETISREGQLYGNRNLGNRFNCSNLYLFSYPGYSEMLVGFADRRVHSNKKIINPNATVLECIARDSIYQKSVAVFSTWEVIPYVSGAVRAKLPFNRYGNEKAPDQSDSIKNASVKHCDLTTFTSAFQYLKSHRPHVMMISMDETDAHGHSGRYDAYLNAAHETDHMLSELWKWIQSDDQYRNNTTLIITTDHGRGNLFQGSWTDHGIHQPGSRHIWLGIIGPNTPALGEMSSRELYFQNQVAGTIASLVGIDYQNTRPVGKAIKKVIFFPEITGRR